MNPQRVGFADYTGPFSEMQNILSCSAAVDETTDDQGTTFTISDYTCCCFDTTHQRVAGNPSSPTSCSAVCTAAGLTCDSSTFWGPLSATNSQTAGGEAEYDSSDGTRAYYGFDCATPATAQEDLGGGRIGTLTSFSCGCR